MNWVRHSRGSSRRSGKSVWREFSVEWIFDLIFTWFIWFASKFMVKSLVSKYDVHSNWSTDRLFACGVSMTDWLLLLVQKKFQHNVCSCMCSVGHYLTFLITSAARFAPKILRSRDLDLIDSTQTYTTWADLKQLSQLVVVLYLLGGPT